MSKNIKHLYIFLSITVFILLPILFFILGDTPSRSTLKNVLSIITIISFFILFGQFLLSKVNSNIKEIFNYAKVVKVHKLIGYIVLPILIIHPALVVIPRFFEVGASPFESFLKMITTFDSLGVILGLIAWVLMLSLGLTSMFRNKLNLSYKVWKIFHGILALVFIIFASWHTIEMGRHIDLPMSILIVFLTLISTILIIKTYIFKNVQGAK